MSESARGRSISDGDLLPLVETIYEAALRPDAWKDFLAGLCAAIGAQAAFFQIYDTVDAAGAALWWHGHPDEAMTQYSSWASKNPHLIALTPTLRTGLVVANTPITRAELLKTEYFNDFLRHYLPTCAATGACVYGNGTTQVVLGIDRVLDLDPFDAHESGVLARLTPHLQRAMVIHKRLGDSDLAHTTSLDTLNRLDFGVVLLSRRGRIVEMNDAARAIVNDATALEVTVRGHLRTKDGLQQAKLEALIAGACTAWEHPLRSSDGALTVRRTGTGSPVEVLASPLRLQQFALTPELPAAILFLRDPERSSVPLARLQQIYGLTVAEARVAQRLKTGESVSELSDSLKISITTARTHVRRLLEKFGARSLSDLTRRIAGLPPVR